MALNAGHGTLPPCSLAPFGYHKAPTKLAVYAAWLGAAIHPRTGSSFPTLSATHPIASIQLSPYPYSEASIKIMTATSTPSFIGVTSISSTPSSSSSSLDNIDDMAHVFSSHRRRSPFDMRLEENRLRAELGLPAKRVNLEKHCKHYHEDGNLIIILQEKMAFRVYRGHLARHSEVFRDMMSIAQPSQSKPPTPTNELQCGLGVDEVVLTDMGEDTIDGVPALRLTDDVEDFSYLLDVLLEITPKEPSFEMIEGALRVANKYVFEGVRQWAVSHMKARFPITLRDLLDDPTLSIYRDGILAAKVLALAREFDIPELVPLALYSIVCYDFSAKLLAQYKAGLIAQTLPDEDTTRWIIGRQKLQEVAIEYLFQLREYGIMKISCSRKVGQYQRTCSAGNIHAVWARPQSAMAEFMRDPLGVLARGVKEYDQSTMCGECNASGQAKHVELVEAMFNRLKDIFML